jgi:hypothetical protein
MLAETVRRIGTLTEFYRLTLIRVNFDGAFTILLQELQFSDFNELTLIVGQALNQPPLQMFASKNLRTKFNLFTSVKHVLSSLLVVNDRICTEFVEQHRHRSKLANYSNNWRFWRLS